MANRNDCFTIVGKTKETNTTAQTELETPANKKAHIQVPLSASFVIKQFFVEASPAASTDLGSAFLLKKQGTHTCINMKSTKVTRMNDGRGSVKSGRASDSLLQKRAQAPFKNSH